MNRTMLSWPAWMKTEMLDRPDFDVRYHYEMASATGYWQ